MSEDRLIQALARRARERGEAGPDEHLRRWERMTEGRPVELVREDTPAAGQEEDAGRLHEVYRPLSAAYRAGLVDRLWDELGTAQTGTNDIAAPADPVVVPLRARTTSRRTWIGLGLAASLLLAVATVIVPGPGGHAPLPGYALSVDGGLTQFRSSDLEPASGPGGALAFAPGNQFRLVLTPDTAVEETMDLRLYVQTGTGLQELETPPPQRSAKGAIAVEGDVGIDVLMPDDGKALVVVLSRPGALPDQGEVLARLDLPDQVYPADSGWLLWRVPLAMH